MARATRALPTAAAMLGGLTLLAGTPPAEASEEVESDGWTVLWSHSAGVARSGDGEVVRLWEQPKGHRGSGETIPFGDGGRCPVGHPPSSEAVWGDVLSVVGPYVSYYVCVGRSGVEQPTCDEATECGPARTYTTLRASYRTVNLDAGGEPVELGELLDEASVREALRAAEAVRALGDDAGDGDVAELLQRLADARQPTEGGYLDPPLDTPRAAGFAFHRLDGGRLTVRVGVQAMGRVSTKGEKAHTPSWRRSVAEASGDWRMTSVDVELEPTEALAGPLREAAEAGRLMAQLATSD